MNDLRKMQLMLTDILKVFHDFCMECFFRYYAVGEGGLLERQNIRGLSLWLMILTKEYRDQIVSV